MDDERKRKTFFVVVLFISIIFFLLSLIYYVNNTKKIDNVTISLDDRPIRETKSENTSSLTDLFKQAFIDKNVYTPTATGSQVLDSQFTKGNRKIQNPFAIGSCEINNQTVPVGVVVFDTTCTPDNTK